MREYPDDHGGLLDGSDDLQVAATLRAMLDINIENALAGAFSRNARAQTGSQCMSPFERPLFEPVYFRCGSKPAFGEREGYRHPR